MRSFPGGCIYIYIEWWMMMFEIPHIYVQNYVKYGFDICYLYHPYHYVKLELLLLLWNHQLSQDPVALLWGRDVQHGDRCSGWIPWRNETKRRGTRGVRLKLSHPQEFGKPTRLELATWKLQNTTSGLGSSGLRKMYILMSCFVVGLILPI